VSNQARRVDLKVLFANLTLLPAVPALLGDHPCGVAPVQSGDVERRG
jgi:hypothetical protein